MGFFSGTEGTGNGVVVKTISDQNTETNIEYIFRASAGALTCEIKTSDTNWVAVAFEDLGSTTPGTFLTATADTTTAYRVSGRFMGIRWKQSGGTASNVEGTFNN